MRTAGSAIFVLLSLLLGVVALPAAWLGTYIVAEEGFVRFASPLADDPNFTGALSAALSEEATASANLPPELQQSVQPVVAQIAERVTELPNFDQAWDDSLRRSHSLTFAAEAPAQAEGGPPLFTVDIAPLVGLVTGEIGAQFGVELPAPGQTLITVGEGGSGEPVRWVETAAELWPVLAAASAAAALIGLALARRRSSALALLGLGVMVASTILWLLAFLAPELLSRTAEPVAVAGVFRDALAERAGASFQEWCLAALAGGILLAVAGVIVRLVSGSRR